MLNIILNKSIFILILIFFISCSNKNESSLEKNKLDNKSNVQEDFKIANKIENKYKKVTVIDGIKLSKFLPSGVPDSKRTPNKTGEVNEGKNRFTVASSEYVFQNYGSLKFSITDFGAKEKVPDFELKLFENPPEESGKVTESFVVANGSGYAIWDEYIREGSLFALVADRFIFRIDATRLPKSSLKLQDYFKYYRTKELIKTIKNNN